MTIDAAGSAECKTREARETMIMNMILQTRSK